MRVKVTLALGVALLAAVGAVALTRSPPRVVASDAVPVSGIVDHLRGDISVCQKGETLPADVSAVRLSMWAFFGWRMHVVVYGGSRPLTEGGRNAAWTSQSVTVPVRPLDRATPNAVLCFTIGPNSEPALILGRGTPKAEGAGVLTATRPGAALIEQLPGRVGVEYLASGRGSWWSRAASVAKAMGLGRSFSGTWIAFLVAVVMVAVGALAVRLTLREIR